MALFCVGLITGILVGNGIAAIGVAIYSLRHRRGSFPSTFSRR